MNKLVSKTIMCVILVTSIIYGGCKSDTSKSTGNVKDTLTQVAAKSSKTKTTYKLPSPVELYIFLREGGAKYGKESLNPVDNLSKYLTTRNKAINFGIYASDLAYCTVFAKPQQTFFYFKTAKTLANDLGLTDGFDESISKRIENNLNNTDSLFQITSDSYWQACSFLEEKGKSDILGYILVGGWIESVYIAISSVDKFSAENEVVIRIAEQQFLLENLLENLNSIEKNPQIDEIVTKLKTIKITFDKLYENAGDVIITKTQFNEISSKIKTIRNEFVK